MPATGAQSARRAFNFAGQHRKQRIVPQSVVIVEVLVAQRQTKNPLPHQSRHGVLDKQRIAPVDETPGDPLAKPHGFVRPPQTQGPRVGGHRPAVETGHNLVAFDRRPFKKRGATLRWHRGRASHCHKTTFADSQPRCTQLFEKCGLGVFSAALAAALLLACVPPARAGPVVDRIKADGVIRCGGVSRPGLVGQSPDRRSASGLYLDLCRAIGAALLGPDGHVEFHPYDSDKAFDRARGEADDLSFLDGSEIVDENLAGRTTPGPPVVFVSTAAMVPGDSPVKSLADLAGRSVRFYQGSNAHRNFEAWMAAHQLDFVRMGAMEYVELYDAYDAGGCEAHVGEIGDLAVARLAGTAPESRILPEPLATFPVLAVTPASDPQWSAIVAWAIYALQRAELRAAGWTASGLGSLPIEAREVGLDGDWQARVVAAAGTYADIFSRNLGERSSLNCRAVRTRRSRPAVSSSRLFGSRRRTVIARSEATKQSRRS